VEEMVTNNARWERKIEETKQSMKKNPLHLGLLLPSFAADPGPSPFSGPPLRVGSESPVLRKSHLGRTSWEPKPNHASGPAISHRRHSSAFLDTIPSTSQSPELGLDKSTSIPGIDSPASHENLPQSRRGSADAALTAIVVTQTPNSAQVNGSSAAASSPADKRKDTTKKYPAQNTSSQNTGEVANGGARPLTAPAPARSNNNTGKSPRPHKSCFFRSSRPCGAGPDIESATKLFPLPHTASQSHSDVNFSHTANGTLDAPNLLLPDMPKFSPDSDNANPSRESARRSEWWRLNSRRRAGENRDGEIVPRDQHKEMMLRRSISNTDATTASPTTPSPTRTTMTGKLKTFFKRRPRNSNDHEKQLSSFGSSSQLRTTPPTSDPGVSVNSDD
jgi:3',5'-cyclic-nucleotide phosphodiesterase